MTFTYYHINESINQHSSSYYHPDHLGSTSIVTNSTGGVVENTSYNPYGEVIQEGKSRFLFTGKELDRETNFEYYGARYYYPFRVGFIQPDLIIQDYYNPQSLNRYAYVLNNPYKYVDPTGKGPELAVPFVYFAWQSWGAYLSVSPTLYSIEQGKTSPLRQTFYDFSDAAISYIPGFGDVQTGLNTINVLNVGLEEYKKNDENRFSTSKFLVETAPDKVANFLIGLSEEEKSKENKNKGATSNIKKSPVDGKQSQIPYKQNQQRDSSSSGSSSSGYTFGKLYYNEKTGRLEWGGRVSSAYSK